MVAPQFSWDTFKKNKPQQQDNQLTSPPQQEPTQPQSQPQDLSWGNFQTPNTYQGEVDPTEEESTIGYLTRNIVSNAARGAEAVAGAYGNIQQFAENLLVKSPASAGILGKAIETLVGKEKWEKLIKGEEKYAPKLPTSEDLKGITEQVTGDYTKPKTKREGHLQELTGDIASVLSRRGPAQRAQSTQRQLLNNVGIPVAANAAKHVVEDLGFGEEKGQWSKMAAWTALTLSGNINANAYAAALTNQGRNGMNPNLTANLPAYEQRLNRVARNMLQGDPRSALAQQQIAGIRQDMTNGQTSIRDLMNRYDAINAAKRDRGLFELNRADRAVAVRNINQVLNTVREEIQNLGQNNPQALQQWQNGIRAFAVIHRSNAMTNWIQDVATGPYAKILTGPVGGMFLGTGAAIAKAPAFGGALSAAGAAVFKSSQVAYRVWNDPNLARYYWNALSAARSENQTAFFKNANALNAAYKKKYSDD